MKNDSIEEQIKNIEEEIFNTQKNKATEHHIGKLKAKIAKLRELSDKRKSTSSKGKGFLIKTALYQDWEGNGIIVCPLQFYF